MIGVPTQICPKLKGMTDLWWPIMKQGEPMQHLQFPPNNLWMNYTSVCFVLLLHLCVFVAYLSIYLALTSLNNTVTWCRPPMSTEYFGHSSSVWHWQWKNSSRSPHHFHNNVEYSPVWNSGGRIPRQSEEEVMTQVAVSPRQHGRAKSNTAMRLFSGDGKKYVFQPLGERKTGHKHNAFSSREVVI